MRSGEIRQAVILLIEDDQEMRDGIEKLLTREGYRVAGARNEEEAVVKAQRLPLDLILISSGNEPQEMAVVARRMRQCCGLKEDVPVVIFSVATVDEGTEVEIGNNVFMARPDNFDQLRFFLRRHIQRSQQDG